MLGLEDESDVDSSIHGANSPRISERRMRALLLQADYLSQCIERVRSGSSVNGSIGDYSFKLDESGSDFEFRVCLLVYLFVYILYIILFIYSIGNLEPEPYKAYSSISIR